MFDDFIVVIVPRRRLTADEIHERYHPNFGGIMKSIEKRLSMLEGANLSDAVIVESWIRAGRFYDELTTAEKELYKKYKESWGGGDIDYAAAYLSEAFAKAAEMEGEAPEPPPERGYYHYRLTKRKRPPTPEEHAARVKEVEQILLDLKEEYNSPEAKAQREAEYRELQEIGELRGQAFARGEPMDSIPLPWQKGYKKPEYYKAKTPERK